MSKLQLCLGVGVNVETLSYILKVERVQLISTFGPSHLPAQSHWNRDSSVKSGSYIYAPVKLYIRGGQRSNYKPKQVHHLSVALHVNSWKIRLSARMGQSYWIRSLFHIVSDVSLFATVYTKEREL